MTDEAGQVPLSRRLKYRTDDTHNRLDKTIMAGDPFSSTQRYSLFLQVQCRFHRDIDALYENPTLRGLLPDLQRRRRLELIAHDLADLGLMLPENAEAPVFSPDDALDLPTALGWLYVAEGSSLGAAFLLKAARTLGLSESFAARHLAGAPEGRALHWRAFSTALDALGLNEAEEERAVAGAHAAFKRVYSLIERSFANPSARIRVGS